MAEFITGLNDTARERYFLTEEKLIEALSTQKTSVRCQETAEIWQRRFRNVEGCRQEYFHLLKITEIVNRFRGDGVTYE
jgi:hypothetical protein